MLPMIEKKDNGRTKFSGHKGNKNAKNVIRANGPGDPCVPALQVLAGLNFMDS